MAITLNPGFALIIGALLVMAAPAAWRAALFAASAAAGLFLLLSSEFGQGGAFAQLGLSLVPRELDELNSVFGIGFLIATMLLAAFSGARRDRFEDGAMLVMAGAAVSALFVGDLLSLFAAISLVGLATSWVVLASRAHAAASSGVRLLIWHGLEGLLLLFGLALRLSLPQVSPDIDVLNVHTRINAHTLDGAFIFAALMIRIGAPLAHVWLKDAVTHATSAGAVSLSFYPSVLGLYCLARLFPAEPLLIPIGAVMIVIGIVYALCEDDLSSATAYAQVAQTGMCAALIGVGSSAVANAAAHAFTTLLACGLMQMALGCIASRTGVARLSSMDGLGRGMPASSALYLLGAATLAAVPGLALYGSHAAALDLSAQWENRFLWLLFAATPACLLIALFLRPALSLYRSGPRRRPFLEARFPMLLGATLAGFFCISVGLSPDWLFRLTPLDTMSVDPFPPDRVGPHLELLGAAGAAYLAAYAFRLAPATRSGRSLDIDALYRGPLARAGTWFAIVLLRADGAWSGLSDAIGNALTQRFAAWSKRFDRPYARNMSVFVSLSGFGLFLILTLISHLY